MRVYALVPALLPLLALAQDGAIDGPTTSPSALGYSCDPTKCQLPDCACASTNPPGGLQPVSHTIITPYHPNAFWMVNSLPEAYLSLVPQSQVPQFVVFTADDAIQSYTLDAVNQFLAQRKNPNGCDIKMTYFTSLNFTNYTLVTGAHCAFSSYGMVGNPYFFLIPFVLLFRLVCRGKRDCRSYVSHA